MVMLKHEAVFVWIALNPNEIRDCVFGNNDAEFDQQLLHILDDTISTFIPPDLDLSLNKFIIINTSYMTKRYTFACKPISNLPNML
jgi:hypothetical protein